MSNTVPGDQVAENELLARFVTLDRWVRPDKTVKQDAFIPPNDLQLSVTRHLNLSERQLWELGQTVAKIIGEKRTAGLFGRADIANKTVVQQSLMTEAAPLPENPNHAHITRWPLDKPARKQIAQQLAAAARFVLPPVNNEGF
jgi:hypothetical protein